MSAGYRRVLSLTKTRLSGYVDNLTSYNPIIDDSLPTIENIEALEAMKRQIDHDIHKINRSIFVLEEWNSKWLQFLNGIEDDNRRETENSVYEAFIPEDDNFFVIIDTARESIDLLDSKGDEVVSFLAHLKEKHAAENPQPIQAPNPPVVNGSALGANNVTATLPPINCHKFDGNPRNFKPWWDIFDPTIHQLSISGALKYRYLLSYLDVKAARPISGLKPTDQNYQIAIDILFKRYYNKEITKKTLYNDLQKVSRTSEKPHEMRRALEAVESICRQLEDYGENIDHPQICMLIEKKFPKSVFSEVHSWKRNKLNFTTSDLLGKIDEIISFKEEVNELLDDHEETLEKRQPQPPNQPAHVFQNLNKVRFNNFGRGTDHYNHQHHGSGHLNQQHYVNGYRNYHHHGNQNFSNQNLTPNLTPPTACPYCGGWHYSTNCHVYPSTSSRKKILSDKRLCFACFKEGHTAPSCDKRCRQCQGLHHQSICEPGPNFLPPSTNAHPLPRQQQHWPIKTSSSAKPQSTSGSPVQQSQDARNKSLPRRPNQISQRLPYYNNYQRNNSNTSYRQANLISSTAATDDTEKSKTVFNAFNALAFANSLEQNTLLMTIKATVTTPTKTKEACLFFDNGSESCFISADLAEMLNLPIIDTAEIALFTFNSKEPIIIASSVVEVELVTKDGSTTKLIANTIDYMTPSIKTIPLTNENLNFLNAGSLDSVKYDMVKPDLLIGSDYFLNFIEDKALLESGHFFVNTIFGDTISGGKRQNTSSLRSASKWIYEQQEFDRAPKHSIPVYSVQNSYEADPISEASIHRFWDLEGIGVAEPLECTDDEAALKKFYSSIRHQDGRYEVRLPWKDEHLPLPTNFGLALGRLRNLWNQLIKKPDMLQRYDAIFKEQLGLSIIEKAPRVKPSHPQHYLAHHAVFHPKKPGKVRQVYDGSAGSPSLNDCLLRGPINLSDISGLWIRFRTYLNIIILDIEKAFLNISLSEIDRDMCRFIWLKNVLMPPTDSNIEFYRFTRICFGLKPSPFLLEATLRTHLETIGTHTAMSILRNLYVDNMAIQVSDLENAQKSYYEIQDIFMKAGMKCQEFASNLTEVNNFFESEGHPVPKSQRVMGINWNIQTDSIEFNLPAPSNKILCKREVLSVIASIFDPIGLLCPVTVKGKIFFQNLWKKNLQWDDPLPNKEEQDWLLLTQNWKDTLFCFKRCAFPLKENTEVDMHVMVDASALAYSACIYLRLQAESLSRTALILSKNRLAPVSKKLTIPQLELMAIVIGVRLAAFVSKELDCRIKSKTLWSDSQVVLYWIKSCKEQKRFIRNRLIEIRNAPGFNFRYIPTAMNPADLSTRGLSIKEFSEESTKSLWFQGPEFLKKDESHWPENIDLPPLSENQDPIDVNFMPRNIFYQVSNVVTSGYELVPLFDASRVDSWLKLLNIACFVLRFCSKCMSTNKLLTMTPPSSLKFRVSRSGRFTAKDHNVAEDLLIQQAQEDSPPSDKHYNQLELFYDNKKLIRCQGRLSHSSLSEDAIHPIFLPPEHPITRLIILFFHSQFLHAGLATTLAAIRDRFWIPSGRRIVKSVLRQCMHCRRYNARPYRLPPYPSFPEERVSRAPIFSYCGLDYIGPVSVKLSGESQKLWIVLFVCMCSRAVHLEHVLELTSMAFINAFRRFTSRRGSPKLVYSDNASTFCLAEKSIKAAWNTIFQDEATTNYFAKQSIEWKYIIPTASWQGGHYERLVSLVKNCLRRSIGRSQLNFEAFITLLTEAEAIVNARPITYIYDELNSCQILRPSDFLHPDMNAGISPIVENHQDEEYMPPSSTSKDKLLMAWKKSMKSLDKFWTLFENEYLKGLRERYQRCHNGPRSQVNNVPKPNEIVLLREENTPRGFWKLARIIEINRSSDGQTRSALIELSNKSQLQRPISALYPLEVTEDATPPPEAQNVNLIIRSSRRIPVCHSLIGLALLLSIFIPTSVANVCAHNEHLTRIHSQTCVKKGVAVMNDTQGNLCWTSINCPMGHLQPVSLENKSYCGPECECFSWTKNCSYYNGTMVTFSTIENATVAAAIEAEFPSAICSLKPSNFCDSTPLFGIFNQVMLYDLTTHLVSILQIQQIEALEEDLICVGDLTSTSVIGTSRYCDRYKCDLKGNQFCYYPENELVLLLTEHASIALKAWGTVSLTYYTFPRFNPQNCHSCAINCQQGGALIKIENGIQRLEVCASSSTSICYLIEKPEVTQAIHFPAEILIENYQVNVRGWKEGFEIVSLAASCDPQPFCEQISCTLCWLRVANPQCIPRETLFVLLFIIYTLTVILYYLAKILYYLYPWLYPFTRGIFELIVGMLRIIWNQLRCLTRYLRLHAQNHIALPRFIPNNDPHRQRFRFIPARIRRNALAAALVMAIFHLGTIPDVTYACSEVSTITASHEVCTTIPDGTISCVFTSTTLISLLPKGQEVCLLLRDEAQHALGTITMRVLHVSAICKRDTLYYTRSFSMQIQSSKRCPHAGSCTSSKCISTELNDKIEELAGKANESPGHTFCFEIGEGFKFPGTCDYCFNCATPACLFFRTYAVPSSEDIFEVFKCPLWETEVKVLLTTNIGSRVEDHTLALHLGQTTSHNHIKLTLVSSSLPPAPTLGSSFIFDGKRVALLPGTSPRGQPVPGLVGSLQCSNKERARSFNCSIPPSICSCHTGYSRPQCTCSELDHEQFFREAENVLPLELQGLRIEQNNGDLEALFSVSSSIQLQMVIQGLRAIIKIDFNTCDIQEVEVNGCYQCCSGAKIRLSCKTNFGETLASIHCGNHSFVVPCNSKGISSTSAVNFNKANLNERCTVTCPGGTAELFLTGTLAFIDAPMYSNYSTIKVNDTSPHGLGFGLPNIDFFSVMAFLTSNWTSIGAVIAIVILAYFTISFLPCVLQKSAMFLPPPYRFIFMSSNTSSHVKNV